MKYDDWFVLDSGLTFAILPVTCWDGSVAWMRWVGWVDVMPTMFYNPYQVERVYSITPKPPVSP